jgi:tetratricopeptide (TPR) repeat protein
LATEPIVYISSQSVVLSAVFYLLSFRLFLGVYGGAAPSDTKLSWLLRAGSYGAFGLALMSKPIAITLPLNLLSWELLLARPTPGTGLSKRLQKHLPYFAVSAGFILLRGLIMEGPFGAGAARPVVEHVLTQTRVLVWYYLGHALAPLGLNVDPEFPTSVSLIDARFLLAVLVLAGLGWLLYWFRRQRTIVFWSAWFPICLLLTTYGVVILQVVSEHRVYLSLVGFSAVVALLFARLRQVLEQRVFQRHKPKARLAVAIPVALLMLFYGYQTHSRNAVWSSELTLWEDSVAHGGSWRAYLNYAHALEKDGQADEALAHFQKAVELGPYALSHTNLGLAYLERGKTETGLEHLRLAAQLFPGSAETRYYLAYGLESIGALDEAEAELQQALALRPDYVDAYANLAALHEKRERYAEAAEAYRRVLEIDPVKRSDPEILFRVAFSYQMQGNREGAAEAYENLLVISPDHRQGNFNLAYLYAHGENREEWVRCVALFERVLEIDPEYSEALFHLSTVYRQLGDAERAAEYDREHIERGTHEDLIERSRARLGTAH